MTELKKMKIIEFLKVREDKIKPDEANKLNLKRLEKIDFSGQIHLVENKKTGTDMILIKTGDLVISGINVEKGALSIYEGKEDVLATIHYSSYIYDKKLINVEYLKWYLKSPIFFNILKSQAGAGIKTEIKPKKFLSLEISLPDLNKQQEIVNKLSVIKDLEKLISGIKSDSELLMGAVLKEIFS